MLGWTKSSDWLSVENAKAQVAFYETDLDHANRYYAFVMSVKGKVPNWFWHFKIASRDVKDSIRRLSDARVKLVESEELDAKTTKAIKYRTPDGRII